MKKIILFCLVIALFTSCGGRSKTGVIELNTASINGLDNYFKPMNPEIFNRYDKQRFLNKSHKIMIKMFSKGIHHEKAVACMAKDSNACLELANALEKGEQVKRVPKYAFEINRFACVMNNIQACKNTLDAYLNGAVRIHHGWIVRLSDFLCKNGEKTYCESSMQ